MIYIDSEFNCHSENLNGEYRAFDEPFFYGKCKTFIEGHIYVPYGESMTDRNGKAYRGKMITPWKPHAELVAAQAQYELMMAEAAAAYREGVDSVD